MNNDDNDKKELKDVLDGLFELTQVEVPITIANKSCLIKLRDNYKNFKYPSEEDIRKEMQDTMNLTINRLKNNKLDVAIAEEFSQDSFPIDFDEIFTQPVVIVKDENRCPCSVSNLVDLDESQSIDGNVSIVGGELISDIPEGRVHIVKEIGMDNYDEMEENNKTEMEIIRGNGGAESLVDALLNEEDSVDRLGEKNFVRKLVNQFEDKTKIEGKGQPSISPKADISMTEDSRNNARKLIEKYKEGEKLQNNALDNPLPVEKLGSKTRLQMAFGEAGNVGGFKLASGLDVQISNIARNKAFGVEQIPENEDFIIRQFDDTRRNLEIEKNTFVRGNSNLNKIQTYEDMEVNNAGKKRNKEFERFGVEKIPENEDFIIKEIDDARTHLEKQKKLAHGNDIHKTHDVRNDAKSYEFRRNLNICEDLKNAGFKSASGTDIPISNIARNKALERFGVEQLPENVDLIQELDDARRNLEKQKKLAQGNDIQIKNAVRSNADSNESSRNLSDREDLKNAGFKSASGTDIPISTVARNKAFERFGVEQLPENVDLIRELDDARRNLEKQKKLAQGNDIQIKNAVRNNAESNESRRNLSDREDLKNAGFKSASGTNIPISTVARNKAFERFGVEQLPENVDLIRELDDARRNLEKQKKLAHGNDIQINNAVRNNAESNESRRNLSDREDLKNAGFKSASGTNIPISTVARNKAFERFGVEQLPENVDLIRELDDARRNLEKQKKLAQGNDIQIKNAVRNNAESNESRRNLSGREDLKNAGFKSASGTNIPISTVARNKAFERFGVEQLPENVDLIRELDDARRNLEKQKKLAQGNDTQITNAVKNNAESNESRRNLSGREDLKNAGFKSASRTNIPISNIARNKAFERFGVENIPKNEDFIIRELDDARRNLENQAKLAHGNDIPISNVADIKMDVKEINCSKNSMKRKLNFEEDERGRNIGFKSISGTNISVSDSTRKKARLYLYEDSASQLKMDVSLTDIAVENEKRVMEQSGGLISALGTNISISDIALDNAQRLLDIGTADVSITDIAKFNAKILFDDVKDKVETFNISAIDNSSISREIETMDFSTDFWDDETTNEDSVNQSCSMLRNFMMGRQPLSPIARKTDNNLNQLTFLCSSTPIKINPNMVSNVRKNSESNMTESVINIKPFPGLFSRIKTSGKKLCSMRDLLKGRKISDERNVNNLGLDYNVTFDRIFELKFKLSGIGATLSVDDGGLLRANKDDDLIDIEELFGCFLCLDGVDIPLVSRQWFLNHYQLILWKLVTFQHSLKDCLPDEWVSPRHLMLQLKYRYDREIDSAKRPALRRIAEQDDTSGKRLVLVVVSIDKNSNDVTEVIVSDGWYCVPAIIDKCIKNQILNGRVKVGTKLVTCNAVWFGFDEPVVLPCSSFPANSGLRLCGNSTRRARNYSKLGFQSNSHPFPLALGSLNPIGGVASMISVVVNRIYPIQYMETVNVPNEDKPKRIFRNQRAEQVAEKDFELLKENVINKTLDTFSVNCSVSKSDYFNRRGCRAILFRVCVVKGQRMGPVTDLQTGEEILNWVNNAMDQENADCQLSRDQQEMLRSYKEQIVSEALSIKCPKRNNFLGVKDAFDQIIKTQLPRFESITIAKSSRSFLSSSNIIPSDITPRRNSRLAPLLSDAGVKSSTPKRLGLSSKRQNISNVSLNLSRTDKENSALENSMNISSENKDPAGLDLNTSIADLVKTKKRNSTLSALYSPVSKKKK